MWQFVIALVGCGSLESAEPKPEVPEQCKNVHVDRLAADWVAVRGNTADAKTRIRIMEKGDGYEAWYVGGFFARRVMKGEKRDNEVRFTEVPTAERQKRFQAGELSLDRVYLKPSLRDCALKAYIGSVDKSDTEKIPPTAVEFVIFPEQEGVTFSYQPGDDTLFLGEAATDLEKQAAELEEHGGPKPDHEFGEVPVGMFSDAAADGDAACTYDMDLYFDDMLEGDLSPQPAGEVVDGKRPWAYTWSKSYAGNHHFEHHRYRTCADGARTLIGVASLEAILQ